MKIQKYHNLWEEQEKEWMRDPEFVKKINAAEPEYQVARAIIAKRLQQKLTQQALAKKAQTSQSAIARAESGTHPISLTFLKKLAHAMDSQVSIKLQ